MTAPLGEFAGFRGSWSGRRWGRNNGSWQISSICGLASFTNPVTVRVSRIIGSLGATFTVPGTRAISALHIPGIIDELATFGARNASGTTPFFGMLINILDRLRLQIQALQVERGFAFGAKSDAFGWLQIVALQAFDTVFVIASFFLSAQRARFSWRIIDHQTGIVAAVETTHLSVIDIGTV